MIGAAQVLAAPQVDRLLDREHRVERGDRGRRQVHQPHAPVEQRRGEAGDVADHSAAHADDHRVLGGAKRNRVLDDAFDQRQCLVPLAGVDLKGGQRDGVGQRPRDRLGMRGNVSIDNEVRVSRPCRPPPRAPGPTPGRNQRRTGTGRPFHQGAHVFRARQDTFRAVGCTQRWLMGTSTRETHTARTTRKHRKVTGLFFPRVRHHLPRTRPPAVPEIYRNNLTRAAEKIDTCADHDSWM